MTFREFWPLYLRAHRLPGTRLLHYFATAIGVMAAVEAVLAREPMILFAGAVFSYAIARVAHWLERDSQPRIRSSGLWSAAASIRMCWLAITGKLGPEMRTLEQPKLGQTSLPRADSPAGGGLHLLLASAAGLAAGLLDLRDMVEPAELSRYPMIQLGVPIMAFAAALMAASTAWIAAWRDVPAAVPTSFMPPARSVGEGSLRRACIALLVFGMTAFGSAEVAEHGVAVPAYISATLALMSGILLLGLVRSVWPATRGPATQDGPRTRGLRVDGRAQWVDLLEDCLSLGHRKRILKATLDAGELRPGDRLVDVGCGTGELVLMAAHRGLRDVTGFDATPGMIEIAERVARASRCRAWFEVAVAEALPLPDRSVDAVVSSFFFHHLPSDVKRDALREMWRVLAPGGRLVIADYGRPHGLVGLLASFPMRFNYHEYVRPQLKGELERLVVAEGLANPTVVRRFLGYITVLRLVKPACVTASALRPGSRA
jgi:ubiquinone/menaquinone biosynthesis C-methylase UbiE